MTMKERRLHLQNLLSDIPGVKKVYFSPPSKGMVYPCIVYEISNANVVYADDIPYFNRIRWTVTIIDKDPISEIPSEITKHIQYQMFDRKFVSDGLNHYVYTVFY